MGGLMLLNMVSLHLPVFWLSNRGITMTQPPITAQATFYKIASVSVTAT